MRKSLWLYAAVVLAAALGVAFYCGSSADHTMRNAIQGRTSDWV